MKTLKHLKDLQSLITAPGIWCVLPEHHQQMKAKMQDYIAGWDDDDDDDDERTENTSEPVPIGSNPISVINICGELIKGGGLDEDLCDMLGICDIDNVQDELEDAADDNDLQFLLINFDTPGGTPVKELAEMIAKIAETKMVIGYCGSNSFCCSSGYWLASQCTMLFCADSSKVGNVGCFAERVDLTKSLEQQGIKITVIPDGEYKTFGNPATSMDTTEEAMIQERVSTVAKWFRDAIQSKRAVSNDNLQGQVFLGEDAVNNNLADGNFDNIEELLSIFVMVSYA